MFSLPVDQKITHLTMPGKKEIPATWTLRILAENGCWVSDAWQPTPDSTTRIWAKFGDTELFGQDTSRVDFVTNLDDTVQPTRTELKLGLYNPGVSPVSVRWQIWIENIDVTELIISPGAYRLDSGEIKHGTRCAGETGYQVLNIYTPIYVWLMQNREILLKSI